MDVSETKVLLVEDNEVIKLIFDVHLKALGYKTDLASDGLEGFNKWKAGNFDIIFTDCSMPMMSGLEMAKQIRNLEDPKNRVIIIVVTGSPDEYKDECDQLKINKILSKPLDAKDLATTIEEFIST